MPGIISWVPVWWHLRDMKCLLNLRALTAEHLAVRNTAGLFDVSHMGEVWVKGPEITQVTGLCIVQ